MRYATYNITDDRIRLFLGSKPSAEQIESMRKAGFAWWPGSKLNVAKWSVAAEDYVLSLGLEIEEDDTPDDLESRVDRFSSYADNAKRSAESANAAVNRIADNIPLGQPILTNHHSERHARADAKRIENGMRKAVSETERAAYWLGRIAASISHAAYRERPDVISRRIKNLESEYRSIKRNFENSKKFLSIWQDKTKELTIERAKHIANFDNGQHFCFTLEMYPRSENTYEGMRSLWSAITDGIITPEQARELAVKSHRHGIESMQRCLDHLDQQLEYQRALLIAMGGSIGCKWEIEVGGRVRVGKDWFTVLRVNRKDGQIVSVTTDSRYVKVKGVEIIDEYEPPSSEQAAAAKEKTKKAPLCNYPGDGFKHLTQAEWERKHKDYKGTRKIDADDKYTAHRVRYALCAGAKYEYIFINDAKVTWPPAI